MNRETGDNRGNRVADRPHHGGRARDANEGQRVLPAAERVAALSRAAELSRKLCEELDRLSRSDSMADRMLMAVKTDARRSRGELEALISFIQSNR